MKQTEIGLIPDDWEVKSLGEVATIVGGGTPSTLNSAYWNGDIQWFTPAELSDSKKYVSKSERTITERGLKESSAKLLPKGTVLLTTRASIGITAILENPASTNQGFQSLIAKNNCCSEFLYYVIPLIKDEMLSRASGSTFAEISAKKLSTITFQLPPLPEQQRIAKALSDVDALISTTEKLIQKKKNIKQGAMQNLLTGKKRLPGFGNKQTDLFVPNGTHTKEVKDVSPEQIRLSAKMKQTELGEIPEDWEVKSLGEIFEFRPNNTFTRDCLNDSKGEYQNVHYGDVLIKYPSILDCSKESIPFINEGINVKFSKYGIVEGDIIIADTAEDETVGKVVEVFNLGEKKIVSGLHTFLCRKITDDFAPKWLGYFMNQAIFHNQLLPFITGTKVSAISRTAIQNVKVLIPSKEEQTAIANVLSSMDKEIETLNTKLEKYINLKTAMMQQLLTGKIRLR